MITLKKIFTKKVKEWAALSGYNLHVITANGIEIRKCETKTEMDAEGVDYNFPYILYNPYNLPVR